MDAAGLARVSLCFICIARLPIKPHADALFAPFLPRPAGVVRWFAPPLQIEAICDVFYQQPGSPGTSALSSRAAAGESPLAPPLSGAVPLPPFVRRRAALRRPSGHARLPSTKA